LRWGQTIPLTEQKLIFERFACLAKSRRGSVSAGLGLSIVLALALTHGGKVYLKSDLEVGNNCTIVLPLTNLKQKAASYESHSHS